MIQFIKAEKNVALDIIVPCYDGEWSSAYVTAPTAPDSEKSQDKGAFADCTNEWTEIGTSGVGYLSLTAAETNYDLVIVKITSSTVGANFPLIEIHTEATPALSSEMTAAFTTTDALISGLNDISVANILDGIIEGTLTLQDTQKIVLAVLSGIATGGGTTSITFRNTLDTKDVVVATVDTNGNRSAVTRDVS